MAAASLAHPMPSAARLAVLPPLPPRGSHADAVAPAQRNAVVAGIVALHVVAVWGLLQIREVREAVAEAAPMFVNLIAPETKKPETVPPPPLPVPVPQLLKKPPPQLVAAAPSPTPSTFVVPEKTPEIVEPSPPAPVVAALAPPAPPPPVAPKIIPASAVQYLEPIALEYPRLAQRAGETGTVTVAVYVDESGLPKTLQVSRSSGHPRLDDAALAAVRKARFKPWTENGAATAGWAFVPIKFELEK